MSFQLIAKGANTFPLLMELKRQPKLFGRHSYRREMYHSPHTEMTDIWVRYNAIENFNPENPKSFNDEHDSVWYPAYYSLPSLRPIVFQLMQLVEGERLGAVLITKIPPGGGIAKHVDEGWHAEYYDKYYIPIQNAKGARFCFENGSICPDEGDIYWFDNSVPHWVENNSPFDRIAMIVCIRSNRVKGANNENR